MIAHLKLEYILNSLDCCSSWVCSGLSLYSIDSAVQKFSNVIPSPLSTFAFVSFVLKPSCPFQIVQHFSHVLSERFIVSSLTLKSSMNFSLVYIV